MSQVFNITVEQPNIVVDTTANVVTVFSTTTNVELNSNIAIYEKSVPGATGAQGATGPQGPEGPQGPVGATGIQGPVGETGLGFKIARVYESVAALLADTEPTGILVGEFALIENGNVEDPENSRLYIWTGASYDYVTDLSGAAGITGAQGSTGATGPQGETGLTGATGPQGEVGSTGATGVGYRLTSASTNIIELGNKTFTVSLDAADSMYQAGNFVVAAAGFNNFVFGQIISYTGNTLVMNVTSVTGSGTFSGWSFFLQGAPGRQGSTGATGPQGIQGEMGATGPQGDQGIQGEIGATGIQGIQGETGATGPQGIQGSTGLSGGFLTSSSELNLVTGSQTFFVEPPVGHGLQVTDWIRLVGPAGGPNYLEGQITAVDAGQITFNVTEFGGTGFGTAWNVRPIGYQGATGPQGIQGDVGATGSTGPQGPQGATGQTGATGAGATGAQGIQGETGATGPIGLTGATGASGPKGIDGTLGATGATGPTGPAGATGAGATGAQGATGATGAAGATGPAGATGSSIEFKGAWSGATTYKIGDIVNYIGTPYISKVNNNLNVAPQGAPNSLANWLIVEGFFGPAGATGAQGATGIQGATGAGFNNLTSTSSVEIGTGNKTFTVNTDASASGFQVGSPVTAQAIGSPGNSFGIGGIIVAYSGTSLTVSVISVVGSGTYSNWNFVLVGRNGATGPTGATGPQGPAGATGPNADQSVNTTSNVTFASVNLGGVVNTSKLVGPVSGTTQIELDTWNVTQFQSAKYFVQTFDEDKVQVEEIVLVYANGSINISRYGQIVTGGTAGTFSADVVSSSARLLFTPPGAESMTIRIYKTLMAVSA
jgi:hypothetical protein